MLLAVQHVPVHNEDIIIIFLTCTHILDSPINLLYILLLDYLVRSVCTDSVTVSYGSSLTNHFHVCLSSSMFVIILVADCVTLLYAVLFRSSLSCHQRTSSGKKNFPEI